MFPNIFEVFSMDYDQLWDQCLVAHRHQQENGKQLVLKSLKRERRTVNEAVSDLSCTGEDQNVPRKDIRRGFARSV